MFRQGSKYRGSPQVIKTDAFVPDALSKHHNMQMYGDAVLISALDGSEWLPSRFGRFNPEERTLVFVEYEGGQFLGNGLDVVIKRRTIEAIYSLNVRGW